MKNLAKKLAIVFLSLFAISQTVIVSYAIDTNELLPDMNSINEELKTFMSNPTSGNDHSDQLRTYNALPDVDLYSAVTAIIRTILYLAGSLFVIGAIVAGVMYLAGSANEEFVNKAKKTLGYLGLGIVILSTAYALVTGILQLNLFPD
jgi:hypothetical protein